MQWYIYFCRFPVLFLNSLGNFLRSLAVHGQGCLVSWGWPIRVVLVGSMDFCPQRKHFPSFMFFSRSESVSLAAPSFMTSSSWFGQFPEAVSERGPPLPRENRFAWKIMVSARSAISFAVCKSFGRCSSTCDFTSVWRPEMKMYLLSFSVISGSLRTSFLKSFACSATQRFCRSFLSLSRVNLLNVRFVVNRHGLIQMFPIHDVRGRLISLRLG
jgi:hypothetical protein